MTVIRGENIMPVGKGPGWSTATMSGHPDVAYMTAAEAEAENDRCMAAAGKLNDEHADPDDGRLSAEHQKEFDKLIYRARVCRDHVSSCGARGRIGKPSGSGPAFVNVATGEKIASLTHGDHLAGDHGGMGGLHKPALGVGDTILDLVTGKGGSPEFAANITGSDSSGGYLTSERFSSEILDLARSASVVSRAGAVTVPMDTNSLHMARLTQDVTAQWRQEGQTITSSEVAFDRVTLKPHTVAALTTLSIELLEDASNAADIIQNSITQALGLALDQAALFGAGSEAEPLGLVNTTGVNSQTSVGTPDAYDDLTTAVKSILAANFPGEASGLAWLANPRDFATYDGLTDTTGQPLRPTPWASQLRPLATTSFPIADGDSSTSMIVGDFSQMILGMRTSGVRLEIFRDGSVTDGNSVTHNAITQMKVHIRAYLRADVAVMRPTWFTKLTGVTAA